MRTHSQRWRSGVLAAMLALAAAPAAQAQQQAAPPAAERRVAITFDDLPYVHASTQQRDGKRSAADAN
ncbi:hypothetical protein, partial [Serratia marcescens]